MSEIKLSKDDLMKIIFTHPYYNHSMGDLNNLDNGDLVECIEILDEMGNNITGSGLFDSLKSGLKKLATKGNTLINNIYRANNCDGRARQLEDGEVHWGCHNYTGPGTRIDKYPDYPPYNDIDNCSRTHDLAYRSIRNKLDNKEIDEEEAARQVSQADLEAVQCYGYYPHEDGYKAAITGITGKYLGEKALSKLRGKDSVIYY